MNKKTVVLLVVLVMLFSLGGAAAASQDYSDHWAEKQIADWMEKELITGYADGSFQPNDSITRAEFFALINRIFGFERKAPIDFTDVSSDAWYNEVIGKALAAGYVFGYPDGTIRPNNPITRQEASKVISLAYEYNESSQNGYREFTDAAEIGTWAREYVSLMKQKGIITGYLDGSFGPNQNITRAETVVMLSRASGQIYNKAGVYSENAEGNVIINQRGIVLKDMTIAGDLYLAEGIGEGEVTLKGVTVKGDTVVKGGGINSIIIEDCQFSRLIIIKEGNKVRILAIGNTTINETLLQSGAILDQENLTGEGFGYVTIAEGLDGDALVELIGNFESVEIRAEGIQVQASGGTIGNLEVAQGATNINIDLARDSNVTNLTTNAPVTVTGTGNIETAQVNTDGTKIKAPVKKLETAPGIKVDANVAEPAPKSTGGSGGGGDTKVSVSAISVEGDAVVGATLEAGDLKPTNATVKYQWQRAAAKDGGYVDIEGATGKTYKLVADDAGKWIKVKATGTGNYTGTVESKPVGPVLAASLSWARIDDAEITPDAIGFSDQKLTIDDAVVNSPIYIAIKAENEADEALAARNVIIGEDVNTDSFGVEVVKGYVYSNGSWEKVEDPPKIEYDDSNQYFYYNLNNFEGTIVQVIKLTPKAVNTFTIKVYMVSM